MIDLPDIQNIKADIDRIENDITLKKDISLSILRLDKINSETPGNKIFKLYYFLQKAIHEQKKIITFGGAYSNHLAATAKACKLYGINCTGIVRGEQPLNLPHTLIFCKKEGMHLEFITRKKYTEKNKTYFKSWLQVKFGDHILIPEGGFDNDGREGASIITGFYRSIQYTHICCPVGTATTLAGLIKYSSESQHIIGFSALKNIPDFENRIKFLLGNSIHQNFSLIDNYNFGGYAKKTPELISFINTFYKELAIPTDFVYTAKMMFGVFDLIKKNHFPAGSKILCIHTGGLQGNLSLPNGTLNF